jgi:hypothetical protein
VGLADKGDFIAAAPDQVGDEGKLLRHLAVLVVHRPRGVRIAAAQNRRTRRQAQRVDAEGVLEYGAFAADAIDVGSVQQLVACEG